MTVPERHTVERRAATVRAPPLLSAAVQEVRQRVDPCSNNIGVAGEVPRRLEVRARVVAEHHALRHVVDERVGPRESDLRVLLEIPP